MSLLKVYSSESVIKLKDSWEADYKKECPNLVLQRLRHAEFSWNAASYNPHNATFHPSPTCLIFRPSVSVSVLVQQHLAMLRGYFVFKTSKVLSSLVSPARRMIVVFCRGGAAEQIALDCCHVRGLCWNCRKKESCCARTSKRCLRGSGLRKSPSFTSVWVS